MMASKTPTARELVLKRYPDAFVHDDGEGIYVKLPESEMVVCPACGRPHERRKYVDRMPTIGSAGNERSAWESAATGLGLI